MSATKELLALDKAKSIRADAHTNNSRFSHSDCLDIEDPTGISNEEGELLYGLIRCIKPKMILETGTNIGVSTIYMALACRDNGFGSIITVEHLGFVADRARKKIADVGLTQYINVIHGKVEELNSPIPPVDFIWLDTEFKTRYEEMNRFLPSLSPGGFVGIHDLCDLRNPEYGGVPTWMRTQINSGELRLVTFNTASGVVIFQKARLGETAWA